ncbi:hypothetical protein [uncultured Gimesia sp.]|uniref:hypothetical protein n=1 Tax=uncultured Gimesia sp. TaxID=1678688 RepID=UPI0030DB80F5|tara:strand:+ start:75004 stop:75348 length:345 start_codon:yes stop_codon:yes gene_type:complete
MGAESTSKSLREEINLLNNTVSTLKTKVRTIEKKVRHVDDDSRGGMKINSNLQINGDSIKISEKVKVGKKRIEGKLEIRAIDGLGEKKHGLLHHTYQGKSTSIRTTKPIHNVNY